MGFGDYPAEYNPKVHGPYDPARFYGKPDTPLGEVKVGEVGAWLARRNKSPQAAIGAISRAWWRWQHKYMLTQKQGMAGFIQLGLGLSALFYYFNYTKLQKHRNVKYHW